MTFKTLLTAAALTILPGLAMAAGCNYEKEQQAMSCAEGSSFDEASGTCTPVTTS